MSVHTGEGGSPICQRGGGGTRILPYWGGGTPSFPIGGVPHPAHWWYPHFSQSSAPPSFLTEGTPPSGLDGVRPPPPLRVRRQSSIASTSYFAGGMPLAFTHEDCRVSTDVDKLLDISRQFNSFHIYFDRSTETPQKL